MMGEEAHERAALYALGLLDADEAGAFERELVADGELRALTADLRETVAALAWTETNVPPPPELKARVLARVAEESRTAPPVKINLIAGPSAWTQWAPWAVAAALAIFCVVLNSEKADAERHLLVARGTLSALHAASAESSPGPDGDPFTRVSFCALAPVPAAERTGPQAAVRWAAARRKGRLRGTKLPPAAVGKDYQLWTVEAGRKDPVSAGVVKVGADGSAEIEFQPQDDGSKAEVAAFALSMERAGGAAKNAGPGLYLGQR